MYECEPRGGLAPVVVFALVVFALVGGSLQFACARGKHKCVAAAVLKELCCCCFVITSNRNKYKEKKICFDRRCCLSMSF